MQHIFALNFIKVEVLQAVVVGDFSRLTSLCCLVSSYYNLLDWIMESGFETELSAFVMVLASWLELARLILGGGGGGRGRGGRGGSSIAF